MRGLGMGAHPLYTYHAAERSTRKLHDTPAGNGSFSVVFPLRVCAYPIPPFGIIPAGNLYFPSIPIHAHPYLIKLYIYRRYHFIVQSAFLPQKTALKQSSSQGTRSEEHTSEIQSLMRI